MISYKAMSNFMQLFPVLMMMTERTEILCICHGRTTLYHSLLFRWLPHGNNLLTPILLTESVQLRVIYRLLKFLKLVIPPALHKL